MASNYEKMKLASRMFRDAVNSEYRTESIEVNLPDNLAAWAFSYCAEHDLTPSEFLEEVVMEYVKGGSGVSR